MRLRIRFCRGLYLGCDLRREIRMKARIQHRLPGARLQIAWSIHHPIYLKERSENFKLQTSSDIMTQHRTQRPPKPPVRRRHFASDNYAGICPEAFAAMHEANERHESSYGNDSWTQKASDLIREVFETDCEVFFVFNGTSANSLSLASLCQSYNSVLCHELAHLESAECGAPEFFSNGAKVLLLAGANGKISPQEIERAVNKRTDIHYPKPRVLSLTQATEVGTVYSLEELRALSDMARHFGLRVHMDGAR